MKKNLNISLVVAGIAAAALLCATMGGCGSKNESREQLSDIRWNPSP